VRPQTRNEGEGGWPEKRVFCRRNLGQKPGDLCKSLGNRLKKRGRTLFFYRPRKKDKAMSKFGKKRPHAGKPAEGGRGVQQTGDKKKEMKPVVLNDQTLKENTRDSDFFHSKELRTGPHAILNLKGEAGTQETTTNHSEANGGKNPIQKVCQDCA